MLKPLNKTRTGLLQKHEPPEENAGITEKTTVKTVVPLLYRSSRAIATHEKLWPEVCQHCREELELLAFKGSTVLLGCSRPKCEHKTFRIEISLSKNNVDT
jgi:hypothetical protein